MALGAINGGYVNAYAINEAGGLPVIVAMAAITQANATTSSAGVAAIVAAHAQTSEAHTIVALPGELPHSNLIDWTLSRGGDPSTIGTAVGTVVNDPDLGECLEIDYFDVAGENILAKSVLPCLAGNVYRVTARVKVMALPPDGAFTMNLVFPGLDGTFANNQGTYFGANTIAFNAVGQIGTVTEDISDVAAGAVRAWPAGSLYIRAGLRHNTTETGPATIRIGFIRHELVAGVMPANGFARNLGVHSQQGEADALAGDGETVAGASFEGDTSAEHTMAGATSIASAHTSTEQGDASASAGTNATSGATSTTEDGDTLAAALLAQVGAAHAHTADDFTHDMDAGAIAGASLAQTEQGETVSGQGVGLIGGASTTTEQGDTGAGAGAAAIGAASAATQDAQALLAELLAKIGAAHAHTTQGVTASLAGTTGIGASLTQTEGPEPLNAQTLALAQAALAALADGDTLLSDGEIEALRAVFIYTQQAQALAATAQAIAGAALERVAGDHTSLANVSALVGADGDLLELDDLLATTFGQLLRDKRIGGSIARHAGTQSLVEHEVNSTVIAH